MKRAIVLIIFVVASAALVGCPSLSVKSFKFTTYSNYSGNSELHCKSDAEKTKSACAVSFSMLRSYEYMKTASSLAEENIWYDYILIDSAAAGAGALLFESNLNLVKGLGLGAAYIVGLKTYANVDARARYLVTASEASDCVAKAASVCAYQDIDDFSQDVTELNGLINNELMTYNTGFIYPEYKKLYEDALKTALSTESLANQAKYVRNNCKNTVLTNINAIDRKIFLFMLNSTPNIEDITAKIKSITESQTKTAANENKVSDLKQSASMFSVKGLAFTNQTSQESQKVYNTANKVAVTCTRLQSKLSLLTSATSAMDLCLSKM